MAKEYQSEYGLYLIDTDEMGTRIYPNQEYNNPEGESFDFTNEEEAKIYQLVSEKLGYDLWEKVGVYYVMDYDTKLPEAVIEALHLVIIEQFTKNINNWVERQFEHYEEDVWEQNHGY
jgi:hypothetical protein